jgi:hypothetical protein
MGSLHRCLDSGVELILKHGFNVPLDTLAQADWWPTVDTALDRFHKINIFEGGVDENF